MKISVTEEHIRRGFPGRLDSCPIALALLDGGALRVSVGCGAIRWELKSGARFDAAPPRQVRTFIERFDSGMRVKPFEFDLVREGQL